MFFDNSLYLSNAQAITATANSTNVYDVTGAGSGNAPAMTFGNATTFGDDIGLGDGVAQVYLFATIPTTFVTGNGATLTLALQAAPDNGSNAPGTYVTLWTSAVFAVAQLAVGNSFQIPVPPRPPGLALPRFYRVVYTVGTGAFTAGNITTAFVLNAPSINGAYTTFGQYPANFTVGA